MKVIFHLVLRAFIRAAQQPWMSTSEAFWLGYQDGMRERGRDARHLS